jgi:hypothetical protein
MMQIEISDDQFRKFMKELIDDALKSRLLDDRFRQHVTEIIDEALNRPRSPILVSVPQAAAMIGRGVASIYQMMGAGEIRGLKSNGRTLISVASLHAYANSLPEAKIAPQPKRLPQHLRRKAARAGMAKLIVGGAE